MKNILTHIDGTTNNKNLSDTKERNYVNMQVNPCKMCMPMGGAQALKGVKKAMTIIHGSQGCSTYIRRHMAAHYHEPVDIASSSLSEEGTVYGGSKNLKVGIKNLVDMYHPEIVGVLTSCLAETIGDDIGRIVKEVKDTGYFNEVDIIPIATPGYGGSQSEGYFTAIRSILKYYHMKTDQSSGVEMSIESTSAKDSSAKDTSTDSTNTDNNISGQEGHVNIIVSNATCEDIREIKRVLKIMNVEGIILPDISDVLDAPYTPEYNKLQSKGASKEDFIKALSAKGTIELGNLVSEQYSPAVYLEQELGIKGIRLPLPIGVNNSDQFIKAITSIMEIDVPDEINIERGRLLDGMIDSHKHSGLGRVAVYGDKDLVYGISGLLLENGMSLNLASTGSMAKAFKTSMEDLLTTYGKEGYIHQDSDFETIQEYVSSLDVNLMIGNSNGKFITEKEGVDLVRVGFPIHDHIGAQRKVRFLYKGSMRFLDEIVNKLLDQKLSTYRDRMYNSYYPGALDTNEQKHESNKEDSTWQM